jgi:hypothetical protein
MKCGAKEWAAEQYIIFSCRRSRSNFRRRGSAFRRQGCDSSRKGVGTEFVVTDGRKPHSFDLF